MSQPAAAPTDRLSPAALAQIQEMMAQMLQNLLAVPGPAGPRGNQGPPVPGGDSSNNGGPHFQWKSHNIGIFWPDILISYRLGDVVDVGKERYYCNVHSFIAQIRVAVLFRDVLMIRQNLDLCLKGEAQDWWMNQLANVTRVGIMYNNNGVEEWIKALEKRFREAPSVSLGKLQEMRYTEDAQNHCEPSEYITAIATAAKGCGQGNTEFAQVLHAF